MDIATPTAIPTIAAPHINTGPQRLIALLLLLLVLGSGYQIYADYQRESAYQQRVAEVRALTDTQRTLIDGLVTSYRTDAYGNALIDRIAEQQLLANEYSLQALQIMAHQNTQIIDLLSSAR